MIIYRCIISNDEMFTDVYKVTESRNGIFYEVEGKTVTRLEGQIDDALIGGNASAEEVTEGSEASSVSGVDIILNCKLQETAFTKKAYMAYLKDYMKAVRAKLEESDPGRVESFVNDVKPEVTKLLGNFSNYQFFTGESMNPDGMIGLLDYREDGLTPYMLFFKDGLVSEKC